MPQLDRAALTKLCKSNQIFPVYYLFGDEEHYLQLYAKSLVRLLLDRDVNDLNYTRFDADDLDEDALDVELESLPPFCARRVIRIDRAVPSLFCTADKKGGKASEGGKKKLSDRWKKRITDLPDTSCLIFVDNLSFADARTLSKDSAHKQLCKAIEEAGGICVFLGKENAAALTDMVAKRAAKANVVFPRELVRQLVDSAPDSITSLLLETDKLTAWAGEGGTVTKEALKELSSLRQVDCYFSFADHVASGKTADALKDLDYLMSYGNAPELILSLLAKTLCNLYRARAAIDAGYPIDRYCADFSLVSPRQNERAGYPQLKTFRNAAQHELSVLRHSILILDRCEERMKSTSLDKENLLQQAIVEISASKGGRR